MSRLVRAPLTWIVVAECAVVGALILVAWHAIAAASAPGTVAPFTFPAVEASPADSGLPAVGAPVADPHARGPLPGLNVGIGFWRARFGRLNRDEASLEALEWRITHAVMDAARSYIETVVLPAVRRAEGGGP
jgi:hypothetical protein